MKNVIVLFLFLNIGCSSDPAPNEPTIPSFLKPIPLSGISFSIEIDGDSFFYQKKKIEREEIKELIQKLKDHKGKGKISIEIKPNKNAKMESIVFLLELAQKEYLDIKLQTDE